MVLRAARDLEAVALDRVGEDDRRAVGRLARPAQRLEDVLEVVAAEVAHEGDDVVGSVEHVCERLALGALERLEQRRAHLVGGGAVERLVGLVRHLVDPPAQELAAVLGERSAEAAAVLELDHVPAARPEVRLELRGADPRDHAVERLAVEVDDPERVAEPARERLGHRLPEVALVELGVAEERDEAAAGRGAEVGLDIAVGERAQQRRSAAEAHRAGRVVDREGVLRPRWIALQPAEVAEPGQVGTVEPAEQVLERVHHGRGVGLDADAVASVEVGEPERSHERDHRRRRRLVAAHLERVAARPLAVRVVDDPHGEPQDAALDRSERGEVGGGGLRHARRHRVDCRGEACLALRR